MISRASFVEVPVCPARTLCIVSTKAWPRGAETRNPNKDVLKVFAFTFDAAKRCSSGPADRWTVWDGTPREMSCEDLLKEPKNRTYRKRMLKRTDAAHTNGASPFSYFASSGADTYIITKCQLCWLLHCEHRVIIPGVLDNKISIKAG